MAVSKNSRTTVATQHFTCSCGGEVVLKTMITNGKLKNIAECTKCKRVERRPKDFQQFFVKGGGYGFRFCYWERGVFW